MESIPGVKQLVYLCLFAILSTDLLLVHGQSVEVYPKNVTAAEGQNATLLCRTSSPLQYCRFEIPGESAIRLSDKYESKFPGFKYFGDGLEQGVCGVAIQNVKTINNGPVKCILGLDQIDIEGLIDLVVALPPKRPEIKINTELHRSSFEIDQDFQATCISRDGRPPATLQWFLDNEPIVESISAPRIVQDSLIGRNTTLYTVSIQLNRRLRASDDRKFLICRSTHPADQPQEDRFQLSVRYRPQPLQENRVYGLPLGATALVNVTITANPRPRIEWSIDGLPIAQGQQNSRFEAYQPIDLGNGTYNVTLAIAGLTVEDTTKTYYLRASNEFGSSDYSVYISSSPHVAETGIDIGSIIGIIVGVAILLVIVSVIVFARATGKWCFSGASVNTDIGPDSEAQIAPHHDDYEDKEYDHETDERHAETQHTEKNEKTQQQQAQQQPQQRNGNEQKTNTPV
ncbi:fasciclin-3 isoform X2 [Sitodiplosis mosellana]|uniref:fasciclin-3 isoform X2 n=1 Tax=Sitodiplosis mosellana TaxID=263140 RepID=UPI0024445208|nr:fasciclin-3 isoform X2 [Sitodiplosis mosellana]